MPSRRDARSILRRTENEKLQKVIEGIDKSATELLGDVVDCVTQEFTEWLTACHAIEHACPT